MCSDDLSLTFVGTLNSQTAKKNTCLVRLDIVLLAFFYCDSKSDDFTLVIIFSRRHNFSKYAKMLHEKNPLKTYNTQLYFVRLVISTSRSSPVFRNVIRKCQSSQTIQTIEKRYQSAWGIFIPVCQEINYSDNIDSGTTRILPENSGHLSLRLLTDMRMQRDETISEEWIPLFRHWWHYPLVGLIYMI